MSKKRKNNNKNVDRTMKIVLPEGLSSNEMRDIIVSSLLAYDQAKKEPEKEALEKEMQERRQQLGYKDYSRCRHPAVLHSIQISPRFPSFCVSA